MVIGSLNDLIAEIERLSTEADALAHRLKASSDGNAIREGKVVDRIAYQLSGLAETRGAAQVIDPNSVLGGEGEGRPSDDDLPPLGPQDS